MNIHSIASTTSQPTAPAAAPRNKQMFQKLGSSLASGNLDAAKETLTRLQQNAPAPAEGQTNPIAGKFDAISTAIDAGDLKAARAAFKDLKSSLTHPMGMPPGHARKALATASPADVFAFSLKFNLNWKQTPPVDDTDPTTGTDTTPDTTPTTGTDTTTGTDPATTPSTDPATTPQPDPTAPIGSTLDVTA